MWAAFRNWIDDRTGAVGALDAFLSEKIPKSTGWRNTLGSLVGAFLLLQIVSGFLLALYYVPHPDAAYASLEWFASNITLGWFVRALHYWGASFVVVSLFVHVCRVFFDGAYRAPREVNWLIGLALLGVVVTLAFTGQLLPYNRMGYWSSTVGIQIAASAPFIGERIGDLVRGGDTVGALTLTRFYAMHVVLLPILLGLLVGLHLYLLRKHGPQPAADDTTDGKISFFPYQIFRDMVTISIGLAALGLVAVIFKGPDAPPIDLSDTSFAPRPEWYFLAHYELLRSVRGEAGKILVAFVLPNLVLGALVLLPWLDRGKSSTFKDRRLVVGVGTFAIAAVVGLTLFGIASSLAESEAPGDSAEIAAAMDQAETPEERLRIHGESVFRHEKCSSCHMVKGFGQDVGPDLTFVGIRLREDYLRKWIKKPAQFRPDTVMMPTSATGDDFEALVYYLTTLTDVPKN